MPRKLSRRRLISHLTASAIATLAAVPATAAAADCAIGSTSQAFARFGDTGQYFLAPNGGFEQSLTWARGGAVERVLDNDPFRLTGLADVSSLRLRDGGWTATPLLCVSPETPHLRFVAKSAGSGQLDVRVEFIENGQVTDSSSGSVSPSEHAQWAPSRTIDLKVDKLSAGRTGLVRVTLRSQGDWLVDEILVDPYKR